MRGRSQPGRPGCPLTRSQSCPAEAQLRWSRSRPGPPAPGLPLPVGRPLLPWLVLRTEPGELWEAPGQNGRLTRVAAAPVQSHRVPVRETLCRAGEAAAGAPGGTPGRGVPVQREQRPVADGEGGHQPELGRPLCPPGKGEWHGRAQLSPRPAGLSACAGGGWWAPAEQPPASLPGAWPIQVEELGCLEVQEEARADSPEAAVLGQPSALVSGAPAQFPGAWPGPPYAPGAALPQHPRGPGRGVLPGL